MIKFNPQILEEALQAKEALFNHGVVAFPTETVMGLGVLFDDFAAYNKLNKVKERPEDKPYTMMVKDIEQIEKYAIIDECTRRVIQEFMPGSLTVLLRVREGTVPSYVTHGTNVIGMRIPTNIEAIKLLEVVGKPLLVPSANKSGHSPALTSKEVIEIFGKEIDYVMSGKAQNGQPSTIVDLTKETPKVVRVGPIKEEDIIEVWKQ